MLKFPNRWQCNMNSYSSSYMGLPDLMIVHVGRGRRLLWTRPERCLPWMRKNLMYVAAEVQYSLSIKSTSPKQKNNDRRDKTSQSKRL